MPVERPGCAQSVHTFASSSDAYGPTRTMYVFPKPKAVLDLCVNG